MTPLERIYKIWHSCYVLRFWRNAIKADNNKILSKNFVSLNTYTCVELNAHTIVLIIIYLRSHELSNQFLPLLLGSQQCESIFRQVRSFTTTCSTVTNFTVLEFLHKIGRVELQNYIAYRALPHMTFPQVRKSQPHIIGDQQFELPSENEILEVIESAKSNAISELKKLNVSHSAYVDDCCDFNATDFSIEQLNQHDQSILDDFSNDDVNSNILTTVNDIELRDYGIEKYINLQSLPNDAPYVKVELKSGKILAIRKTSICWLFTKEKYKLSSDRLKRVASKLTKK